MNFQNYIDSNILFSVPIYFRSEEEHDTHFNTKHQIFLENQERLHRHHSNEITNRDRMRWEQFFEKEYFHVWKYTEIIGFIEFRKKENNIFAFVFLPDAVRFNSIMNQKKFILAITFPDYRIETIDFSNEQIIEQILRVIDEISKSSRRFRKYYFDKSEVNNYVNLIDYKNI